MMPTNQTPIFGIWGLIRTNFAAPYLYGFLLFSSICVHHSKARIELLEFEEFYQIKVSRISKTL